MYIHFSSFGSTKPFLTSFTFELFHLLIRLTISLVVFRCSTISGGIAKYLNKPTVGIVSLVWGTVLFGEKAAPALSACNLASITYTSHIPLSNPLIRGITANPFFAFIEGFTWPCWKLLFLSCLFTHTEIELTKKRVALFWLVVL